MPIEDFIGKKNFENLKNTSKLYSPFKTEEEAKTALFKLIRFVERKKLNAYRGYEIPIKYKDRDYYNKQINGMTFTDENTNLPYIELYKPLLKKSYSFMRGTIGHELGHAKENIDEFILNREKEKFKNKGFIKEAYRYHKRLKRMQDKINKHSYKTDYGVEVSPYAENRADKRAIETLKDLKLSKPSIKGYLYERKKDMGDNEGRYKKGFVGSARYLKDYLTLFNELPDFNLNDLKNPMFREEYKNFCSEYFLELVDYFYRGPV